MTTASVSRNVLLVIWQHNQRTISSPTPQRGSRGSRRSPFTLLLFAVVSLLHWFGNSEDLPSYSMREERPKNVFICQPVLSTLSKPSFQNSPLSISFYYEASEDLYQQNCKWISRPFRQFRVRPPRMPFWSSRVRCKTQVVLCMIGICYNLFLKKKATSSCS